MKYIWLNIEMFSFSSVQSLSHVQLFATPWTAAPQASLSITTWHLLTWGVHLSVSCLFAFSNCSQDSRGKNTEVVCHSLLQCTTFCQTSSPWPVCLRWPHTAWLSFTELDKAVVCVIRLASCLWLWFQSVCPLMPSLSAYRLTWVSLTLTKMR